MRSLVFRALYPPVTVRSTRQRLNPGDPYKRIRKFPERRPDSEDFERFEGPWNLKGGSGECPYGAKRASDLDQTAADCVPDDAGGVRRVELLHDPCPVGLNGLGADAEELGDLLRRVTLRDELQDLTLPGRQRIRGQRRLRQVGLHQGARDARAQVNHAVKDLVDRPDQIRGRLALDDEPFDANPERFQDVLVIRMHGQENHLRLRAGLRDLPRGGDSVQQRHPVIQQGDVRTVLAGQANGLLPVGRLTGDLKPFLLQEQSDALPDDLVVVSQKNARRHLDTSLTGSGEGGNPESPSNRTRKITNCLAVGVSSSATASPTRSVRWAGRSRGAALPRR